MSDDHHSEVLGALPRKRPHRRSDKRAARPANPSAASADDARPAQPPSAPKSATKLTAEPGPSQPARNLGAEATVKDPARQAKATRKRDRTPLPEAATKPAATASDRPRAPRLRQPAQPAGTPSAPPRRRPTPARRTDVLGTAVQAAAELAEIGLSVSARAIRSAVSKLPRP